jgi:hypothetical protein
MAEIGKVLEVRSVPTFRELGRRARRGFWVRVIEMEKVVSR